MVMTSSLTLERSDAPAIMNYINQLAQHSNLINQDEHWNGVNVLHNSVGKINALELGIESKRS